MSTDAAEQLSILEQVRRDIERNAMRARNGIKIVAGLSKPDVGRTPKDVVWTFGRAQLWHYRNDAVRHSPPLLIIPSLVSRSYILDLVPGNSFVGALVAAGFDVYMLDWGVPDERDAANRFEDYVDLAIPAAIRVVRRRSTAAEVNMLGYCFGGVLSLMHAAHNPDSPLRSLTVFACPVDFTELGPSIDIFDKSDIGIDQILGEDGNVPASTILQAFKSLEPIGEISSYVNLLDRMWNDDFVASHQLMNGWATDHIPFPGATARQAGKMLIEDNGFITGRIELGGDRVTLANVTVPFLAVFGARDTIVPEAASAPVIDLIGSTDKRALRLAGGHVGLIAGRNAHRRAIPAFIEFLEQRSETLP